jgi:hypothetical protein
MRHPLKQEGVICRRCPLLYGADVPLNRPNMLVDRKHPVQGLELPVHHHHLDIEATHLVDRELVLHGRHDHRVGLAAKLLHRPKPDIAGERYQERDVPIIVPDDQWMVREVLALRMLVSRDVR